MMIPPDQHLLNWHNASPEAWDWCLSRALAYGQKHVPLYGSAGIGKQIALVFFNDSLRTRASMEVAAHQLGAYPLLVTPGNGTWGFAWKKGEPMVGGEAEHISEAIAVLSRYVDMLGVRLFASGTDLEADRTEAKFKAIIDASSVPVINLESAFWHPCQALADAAVITRTFGILPKRKKFVLSWASHPKPLPTAVPNSTLLMAARLGMNVVVTHPKGFELDETVLKAAAVEASEAGGRIEWNTDQEQAFEGADIIYAKSWGGFELYAAPETEAERRASHADWRITEDLMRRTHNARFMHCLPVRRGVVVDDAVLDSASSVHLEQAEFRLHAQKAIIEWFWSDQQDRVKIV